MSELPKIEGLEIRYTSTEDSKPLNDWLMEPGILRGFPMIDQREVDDSVRHWISFARFKSSLTAMIDKEACGIGTLCLMPYRKLAHQCLLSIIVNEKMRGKGVGTLLMNNLLHLGKNYFGLEVIYLEVYEENPAISLYRRFGFKECGNQKCFMKEDGQYVGKIIMERIL